MKIGTIAFTFCSVRNLTDEKCAHLRVFENPQQFHNFVFQWFVACNFFSAISHGNNFLTHESRFKMIQFRVSNFPLGRNETAHRSPEIKNRR